MEDRLISVLFLSKVLNYLNMNNLEKKNLAVRVTVVGAILDLLLGVFKVFIGTLYSSHALVIDGVHSLSDIVTDIFVLVVSKVSHDEPDRNHPYGHGRFETIGTVVIGVVLILLSGLLAYDNIWALISDVQTKTPGWPTLIVAVISVLSKEWIYHYTKKVGQKINSQLIIANAWHSRSDAFTSILVFISLVLSMNGISQVDFIVAIIIAVFIGKIGWDFIWNSVKELVDTSLSETKLEEIKRELLNIDGVNNFHNLRSRLMGDKAIVDVNIEVFNRLTVSEGHQIASWVSKTLIDKFDYLSDVTVHTDVEDDRDAGHEFMTYNESLLPLRGEIISYINNELNENEIAMITSYNLHYFRRKISVEIFCFKELHTESIKKRLLLLDYIDSVKFFKEF